MHVHIHSRDDSEIRFYIHFAYVSTKNKTRKASHCALCSVQVEFVIVESNAQSVARLLLCPYYADKYAFSACLNCEEDASAVHVPTHCIILRRVRD